MRSVIIDLKLFCSSPETGLDTGRRGLHQPRGWERAESRGASFSAEGALGQELLEFGFAHSAQIVVSGHQAPLF
jgi:hypothetical protein